jgi:hypothetical protein
VSLSLLSLLFDIVSKVGSHQHNISWMPTEQCLTKDITKPVAASNTRSGRGYSYLVSKANFHSNLIGNFSTREVYVVLIHSSFQLSNLWISQIIRNWVKY